MQLISGLINFYFSSYKKGRISQVLLLCFLLTACQDSSYSEVYLMQHPEQLKNEALRCQGLAGQGAQQQIDQCKIVISAADHFVALINQQQSAPEMFGQQILNIEADCVRLKQNIIMKERALSNLRNSNASKDAMAAAVASLAQARASYKTTNDQKQIYLAVIGLSSPG